MKVTQTALPRACGIADRCTGMCARVTGSLNAECNTWE